MSLNQFKQVRVVAPPPVPNYVAYWRACLSGFAKETILVKDGMIVGHWCKTNRLDLRPDVEPLRGRSFEEIRHQGFQLTSLDVAHLLVKSYLLVGGTPPEGEGQVIRTRTGG